MAEKKKTAKPQKAEKKPSPADYERFGGKVGFKVTSAPAKKGK